MSNKSEFVLKMFNSLAKDYDFMNFIISFGRNLNIKKRAIQNIPINSNAKILDLCTGTGDIAIYIAKNHKDIDKIIGVDFSKNMLEIAAKKSIGINNIELLEADALNLPFEDEYFDISIISYGLRNLNDIEKGLLELKRVTKTNGYVVSLDMGKPKGIYKILFRFYFFKIVPLLGKLFHGSIQPYKYLPQSTKDFPSQEELVNFFKKLGFSEVKNYNFGFGAIAQQVAKV